jgi:hypothetical protein
MGEYAAVNFPCPACGALFALSEKIAQRKIQCPCGKVFVAPAMPEILPDTEAYDVEHHSAPPAPIAQNVAQIAAKRMDLYAHRSIKSFSTDDSEPEFHIMRDRVAPIVLLAIGVAMRIAEIPYDPSLSGQNLAFSIGLLLFQIIVAIGLMLGGVFAAAKILTASYGPLGTAILKLAAMAVFAWAVGAFIVIGLRFELRAFCIAMGVMFIIYSAAFATLFSLDVQEAVATVVICALLQDAAALVIFSTAK